MYEVLLARQAERDLKRLPPEVFMRVIDELKDLTRNPRPQGCRKLTGSKSGYRIRIGDYRILYEIDDGDREVRVLRVGNRRDVYR